MLRYRYYLCRAEARIFDAHPFSKANSGNRTRDHSLEGCRFTAKLYSLKSNCKESRQALLCITLCRQSSPSFSAMFPPPIRWLHTAGPVTTALYTERDLNPHGFEPRDFKARASAIPPSVHGIGRTFRIASSTKEFSLRGLP